MSAPANFNMTHTRRHGQTITYRVRVGPLVNGRVWYEVVDPDGNIVEQGQAAPHTLALLAGRGMRFYEHQR